jgi:diadenosine tetraphosphate (Ap4A) HIT family hydrolase
MINNTGPEPNCPFCRSNGILKGDVIASSPGAFMIGASSNPDNYLIVPEVHAETVQDLPDNWWQDVKALIPQVPGLTPGYNLSLNIGKVAGQTVRHLHFWVIPRVEDTPASGSGLASLIDVVNKTSPIQ